MSSSKTRGLVDFCRKLGLEQTKLSFSTSTAVNPEDVEKQNKENEKDVSEQTIGMKIRKRAPVVSEDEKYVISETHSENKKVGATKKFEGTSEQPPKVKSITLMISDDEEEIVSELDSKKKQVSEIQNSEDESEQPPRMKRRKIARVISEDDEDITPETDSKKGKVIVINNAKAENEPPRMKRRKRSLVISEDYVSETHSKKRKAGTNKKSIVAESKEYEGKKKGRPKLPGKLFCSLCNMKFDARFAFTRHMLTHSEERSFECDVCGMTFKTMSNRNRHRNRLHKSDEISSSKLEDSENKNGVDLHRCEKCNKLFERMHNLISHMRHVHKILNEEQTFACSECEKTFTGMGHLNRHIDTVHKSIKSFKCKRFRTCGAKFSQTSTLKQHSLIHSGTKKYKCKKCGKKFTQKSHVKTHACSHSNKRPFKCGTCGSKFKLKHHVKAHCESHLHSDYVYDSNDNECDELAGKK